MSSYRLDKQLAQQIVDRTMNIINCNINVMNAKGRIIGSGDHERIGELHEGALLALSQKRVVMIDDAMAKSLYGVKPGVNLPLQQDGEIVGVIGLTGDPSGLKQVGELVCMSAEMMMEQARLLNEVAQDSRLREELVLSMIKTEELSANLIEWAQRLGIDLSLPRVAVVVDVDSGQLGVETAMKELHQLQNFLAMPDRSNLVAIQSLTSLVVIIPALNNFGRWELEEHKSRLNKLVAQAQEFSSLKIRTALGNYFPGESDNIVKSYQTALATMVVGKQRMPESRNYYYQDLVLPVLLDSLSSGWQASELLNPLKKLKLMDTHDVLIKTLRVWFKYNVHMNETSKALYIHRNTLEYRLNKISTLTGLNLELFDDRLRLYIALQLDAS
ncbi:CdaR family transcriptional regulator [Zophobihabitans entericus]|uniref:CdaR family transcriptional regulator n=1 Tax=Zophobihabitans entericus TaxID=1635327 RepID=A0A6G9I9N4_9GAMM|nr:CdaR family transcriptional regulator [Zophobihabitans entericus]QIQ20931.1 CdaR family transcriptional regulator [Zophobihabitans entericus]